MTHRRRLCAVQQLLRLDHQVKGLPPRAFLALAMLALGGYRPSLPGRS